MTRYEMHMVANGDVKETAKRLENRIEYQGIYFDNILHLKWAMFFDWLGWKWEYRPKEFIDMWPNMVFALKGLSQWIFVYVTNSVGKPSVYSEWLYHNEVKGSQGSLFDVMVVGDFVYDSEEDSPSEDSLILGVEPDFGCDSDEEIPHYREDEWVFNDYQGMDFIGLSRSCGAWECALTGCYIGGITPKLSGSRKTKVKGFWKNIDSYIRRFKSNGRERL